MRFLNCKIFKLFLFTLLFFYIFISSYTYAQENSYWQKAGNLIKTGNINQALQEINQLLTKKPNDVLLLRLKGICLIKLNKTNQAVKILQKAVNIDPNNIAARFYLAKALTYQGNILEPIDILNFIQEKAPNSPYAKMAEKIIPKLRSTAIIKNPLDKKKRWNIYGNIALEYDDNVPSRSRAEDNTVTDSFRPVISGAFEYRFIDQNIDDKNFTLGARHSLYYSWHEKNKFSSYDLKANSSDIFYKKNGMFSDLPYSIEITGNYSNTRLGDKHYSDTAGISSSVSVEWYKKAVLIPNYSITWEDFKNDTSEPEKYSLDSITHSIGLEHYLQLLNDKLMWGLGYQYRNSNADGNQFDMDSHNIFTSFDLALPHDISLGTRIDYTNSDYTKYDPEPKRLDKIITVNTALTYPLKKDRVFLKIGHTYLRSQSERSFSDYKRNILSISLGFYL